MKYFSEKLNKVFDTPEQLQAEELKAAKAEEASKKKVEKEPKVPTKKQLATDVEQAEEALKKAYSEYTVAKKNAEQLSKDYLAAVEAILSPAEKAVKDAEQKKYEAISKFNAHYGPYQVVFTGSRAADELMKAINLFEARPSKFLDSLFWY